MSRPHSSDFGAWSSLQQQSPSSRSGSGRYTIAPQGTTRQVRRTSYQQTIEPGRIRRTETHRVSPRLSTTDTTDDPFLDQTDGPSDGAGLRHTSRMASSSLSNLGSRVTSDSSASSWASTAIKFKNDYNVLAQQHGLPPFPDQISGMPDQMGVSLIGSNDLPEQDGTPSQTQVTQKVHRHWLSRKFLPRSSSTFTLKAKTAFKPLSRKKSLGGFLARGESASTNVLKDRSLEEVCRLGGTIPLILPPEFALNELFLPASLTTLANYILQQSEGFLAPGIFRENGATSTVVSLYDHFDRQFVDAGSPARVEDTVRTSRLPSGTAYALADVCALFKKIIFQLPGGLLGSMELFDLLRSILLEWHGDSDSSPEDVENFKAKSIALALSGISSLQRTHLIQAVIGLVACFGSEGDKALPAERAPAETRTMEIQAQPQSRIMNSSALSIVFAPVFLGTLSNEVNISQGDRPTPDSTLHPAFARVLVCREVLEALLRNWKSVINQLRDIHSLNSSAPARAPQGHQRNRHFHFTLNPHFPEFISPLQDVDASETMHQQILSRRQLRSRVPSESSALLTRQPTPKHSTSSSGSSNSSLPPVPPLKDEAAFPLRPSSSQLNRLATPLKRESPPVFKNAAEHRAWIEANPTSPAMPPPPLPRKMSGALHSPPVKGSALRKPSELAKEPIQASDHIKQSSIGSVKELARKFSDNATQIHDQVRPTLPPFVFPIPLNTSSEELPGATAKPSPVIGTMIPKPVKDVGHSRLIESRKSPMRTFSPPEQASSLSLQSYERPPVDSIIRGKDVKVKAIRAEDLHMHPQQNAPMRSKKQGTSGDVPTSYTSAGLSRPFSHESASNAEHAFGDSKSEDTDKSIGLIGNQRTFPRPGISVIHSPGLPLRKNSYREASDALERLRRHGSLTPSLLGQIADLQGKIDQKNEASQAAQRRADVEKEIAAARDPIASQNSSRNSWNGGMWNEDVKKAKKDVKYWKKRAEAAESDRTRNTSEDHDISAGFQGNQFEEVHYGNQARGNVASNVNNLLDWEQEISDSFVNFYMD